MLECMSLCIVGLFVIEIPVKLWALGLRVFLHSPLELIDAVVCVISFSLDTYVIFSHLTHAGSDGHDSTSPVSGEIVASEELTVGAQSDRPTRLVEAAGFLVLFRLWRIIRIVNGEPTNMFNQLTRIRNFRLFLNLSTGAMSSPERKRDNPERIMRRGSVSWSNGRKNWQWHTWLSFEI